MSLQSTVEVLNALTADTRTSAQIISIPTGTPAPTARAPECAYVVPQQWAEDVYTCVSESEHAQAYVVQTRLETMAAIIKARYGDTMPTYAQHRADHLQLQAIAVLHCLTDAQVLRKAWNISIKAAFGALPVSDAPAAVAKRMHAASQPKAEKPAKTLSGPQAHPASPSDTVGQYIAKTGMTVILIECAKILAAERATATEAKTLVAIASHLKAA